MELLMEIMGWAGAGLVLAGYVFVSMKKLPPESMAYQALNIGGSVLLAVYAYWHGALASVAVNIIWLAIGILAVMTVVRRASAK